MKKSDLFKSIILIGAICVLGAYSLRATAQGREAPASAPQAVLGTAFTYQGQLQDNGVPATGDYDFRFTLYNVVDGGSPLPGTSTLTLPMIPVTRGQFTVPLDFGTISASQQLYLEIEVRPGGSSDSFIALTPRQAITPVPYAQSVPWGGISAKPARLNWRHIYVPATAMNYTPGLDIVMTEKGLRFPATTQLAGFGVPQPADWDPTTPFTVTLYSAVQLANASGYIQWRLHAGGSDLNLLGDDADTGWDSMYYGDEEDAALLAYDAAGGHFYLMKSQSWVSKWSATYAAWYFGDGVNTGNDFGDNLMWFFYFERGIGAGNDETYTGYMYVVGAEITYLAVP